MNLPKKIFLCMLLALHTIPIKSGLSDFFYSGLNFMCSPRFVVVLSACFAASTACLGYVLRSRNVLKERLKDQLHDYTNLWREKTTLEKRLMYTLIEQYRLTEQLEDREKDNSTQRTSCEIQTEEQFEIPDECKHCKRKDAQLSQQGARNLMIDGELEELQRNLADREQELQTLSQVKRIPTTVYQSESLNSDDPIKFCLWVESFLKQPLLQLESRDQLESVKQLYKGIGNSLEALKKRFDPNFYSNMHDEIKANFGCVNISPEQAPIIYQLLWDRVSYTRLKEQLEWRKECAEREKDQETLNLFRQIRWMLDNPFQQQNFDAYCTGSDSASTLITQISNSSLTQEKLERLDGLRQEKLLEIAEHENILHIREIRQDKDGCRIM